MCRGAGRRRNARDPRFGHGHSPTRRDPRRRDAPHRPVAHAPSHGSHPGTGVLRPALRGGRRGAHLGTLVRHAGPWRAAGALPVAAALSGLPAQRTLPVDPTRRRVDAELPDRRPRDRGEARLSSRAYRRLPHPRGRRSID